MKFKGYKIIMGVIIVFSLLSILLPSLAVFAKQNESIAQTERVKNSTEITDYSLENAKKLFPFASIKGLENLAKSLTGRYSSEAIKSVFYQTTEGIQTSALSMMKKNFKQLIVIFDNGDKVLLNAKKVDESLFLGENAEEYDLKELFEDDNAESIAFLTEYIQKTSIDKLKEAFGGEMTYYKLYNDDPLYNLGGTQISDDREIDAFQLSDKYEDLQKKAADVASDIVTSYPELTNVNTMREKAQEVVFAYTYFHRWYNYTIGDVYVGDIMFAKQSLFADNTTTSDFTHLMNFIEKLKATPWAASNPGMPYAYSTFVTFAPFESEDSLRNEGLGFDSDAITAADGKVYMSSIIEFLIRTFDETTEYNTWFEQQGFLTSTNYLPEILEASNLGLPLWELLKKSERGEQPGKIISTGIITILLSIPKEERIKVILSNSANHLVFSNATKIFQQGNRTPQELAKSYGVNNNAFLEFLLTVGEEEQKKQLNTWLEGRPGLTFDLGEAVDEKSTMTDFYNSANPYLNQFVLAVSPRAASYMSDSGHNAIQAMKDVFMSQNNVADEYTIAHEETHRIQDVLNAGSNLRFDSEAPAQLTEPLGYTNSVQLNYYYKDSVSKGWNKQVPKTERELKNYTQSMMDLIYAWNIEKAKQIFSNDVSSQTGKVYQITNHTIKKMSETELTKLNISATDTNFIEKLIENRIVLPADTTKETRTYDEYHMPVQHDAIFHAGYSETDIDFNWYNIWIFEFIAKYGMKGYVDFSTDKIDTNDLDVIKKCLGNKPEAYLVQRYKEVGEKVAHNQLKDYSQADLSELVGESLTNEETAKRKFIDDFIDKHNNLFDGIYKDNIVEKAEAITVKYLDEANKEIHTAQKISGNIGDKYDATTKDYKLTIEGYALDETKYPENGTGTLSDKAQSVVYHYTKNPLELETYGGFKLGYWKVNRFVLEGQAGLTGKTMTMDNVTKTLEIVDNSGTVIKAVKATNTNWYNKKNYDGYQVILKEDVLTVLKSGDYKLQMRVKHGDATVVMPISEEKTLLRSIGEQVSNMSQLNGYNMGTTHLSFKVMSNQLVLNAREVSENEANPLRTYVKDATERVYDGWLNTDYDYSQAHTKNIVVKDSANKEVYRKDNIANWNVNSQYGLGVKESLALSGFQVKVPLTYNNKNYRPYVEVVDGASNKLVGSYQLYPDREGK